MKNQTVMATIVITTVYKGKGELHHQPETTDNGGQTLGPSHVLTTRNHTHLLLQSKSPSVPPPAVTCTVQNNNNYRHSHRLQAPPPHS